MRIGFLGTGTMSTALVHAIAADGHEILVSERGYANAQSLVQAYENVTISENQALVKQSDILFLGLLAEHAREVLPNLKFPEGQRVYSVIR